MSNKLLFDMYGVLMRAPSPEDLIALEERVAPASSEDFWAAYYALRPGYDAGIASVEHYWGDVLKQCGAQDEDPKAIAEFENSRLLEEVPEMVQLLDDLIDDGHTVGILSNMPTSLSVLVRERHEWLDHCAAVALSCDIGVAKPRPEAYRVAVDALGGTPQETYFFDDNEAYVEGAREAGLNAFLFRDRETVLECLRDLS